MKRAIRECGTAVGLSAVLVGLASCQHLTTLDKAGAARPTPTVIHLQMPDEGDPDGTFFARDVAERSHGSLKVVIDSTAYKNEVPSNERRLVAAMRAGTVGFSYQPARDWAAAGVPAFQALDTPFLVTTIAASESLARSPVAPAILRGLSGLGMVGIGLIPSEPRQILSVRPWFAPTAFHGQRVRIIDNPETAALITALGAQPVRGVSAPAVGNLLRLGSVDGVETQPEAILTNSYNAEAPYLTSYAVIPKFETIVATRNAWATLSANQQTIIRQAAADTLANSAQVPDRDSAQLTSLCRNGVVLDEPSPPELATLVRESKQAIPTSLAAKSMIAMITSTIHGVGPRPETLRPPLGCHVAHSVAQAKSLHRLSIPTGSIGGGGPTIPPGTYVTTDTVADFRAGGQYGTDWNKPITWTWHLYPNGKLFMIQKPDFPDQPINNRGRYVVQGNKVTFIWDPYTEVTPETLRWSYFNGQLSFEIVHVQDTAGHVIYTAHPWRKVG